MIINKNTEKIHTGFVRRPFTVDEDARLLDIMIKQRFINWEQVASSLGGRSSRQCRERWVNYLNPSIRTDPWNEAEDQLLLEKVNELGRCWSMIGKFFNGRSENDVKNRWYSHLRYRSIQDDNGKFKFVKDQSESLYPDRKKRNRVKISPQQNAMRVLEQQRSRQQQQQFQSQVNAQLFQMQFMNMMMPQPQFNSMQQFQFQNKMPTKVARPPVRNNKPHDLPVPIQQPAPVVVPKDDEQKAIENKPQDFFIQNNEESDKISLPEENPDDIPEPEFVDIWDPHLFEEATTENTILNPFHLGESIFF